MNSRKILFWTMPLFYLIPYSVVLAQTANTDEILFFDSSSLFGKKNQNIDLTIFSIKNYVIPGRYLINVSVNNKPLGLKEVNFYLIDQEQVVLCINPQLLKSFDLDPKVLKYLEGRDCMDIKEISADAKYQFDASELKLDFSIPQAYVAQRPKGFISPDRFDSGVSSGFIRYDYNAYWNQFEQNGDNKNEYSQFLNLDAGLNLGQWSYRHQGAFDSRNTSLGQYRSKQNEISRDLVKLRSRLSIGEFINRSVYIESIPMLGIQIFSDIQMLPMSQRSYAPVIESYVQNNALVSIYQNGQKIDERTVAAGAFKITDLNIIATRGDLSVEIKEFGAEKRSFIIPLQSNSNLVRPGQFNYNIALGNYNAYVQTKKHSMGQVSFEYGLNNVMSLYGGTSLSEPYQSQLIGIALNTQFGGINVDSEFSQFEAFNNNRKGQRLQSSYRYGEPSLGLQLILNARFQSEDYLRLNNAMTLYNYLNNNSINPNQSTIAPNHDLEQQYIDFRQNYLLKQQYSVSLNKSFSHIGWGSLYLSLLQSSYWNDPKNYYQMSLSYNNRWHKLSYSVGLSQTENQFSKDQQVYLSLSVPLSFRERNLYSNTYLNYNSQQTGVTALSNLSGVLGEQQQTSFSVGVASNSSQNQDALSVSGNISHRLPKVMLNGSLSHDESHTQSSFSAKGAVVAHAHGLTAVNDLSDTYTIIHADHGQGATVENAWGVKLDRFGNAIYPYSIPYQENQISIDPSNLALNLNLVENKKIVVPKNNSATFVEFKPQRSSLILLMIKNANQRFSMGTELLNQDDQVIGRISQSNEVIVDDETLLTQHLHIQWGDTAAESCNIVLNAKQMAFKANEQGEFNLIEVECN